MSFRRILVFLAVFFFLSMVCVRAASLAPVDDTKQQVETKEISVVGTAPLSPEQYYNLGLQHERGGRPVLAFTYYSLAADSHNERALYKVKCFELLGTSKLQSILQIVQRLTLAAAKGNADAMFRLARCYEEGVGVVQSLDEAIRFYGDAAKKDHPGAVFVLGRCCEYGLGGMERDGGLAVLCYERAARLGYKPALVRLADLKRPASVKVLPVPSNTAHDEKDAVAKS